MRDVLAGLLTVVSVRYARCNNTPAHESLNAKIAALHGAEAAMITGSGMAAITTTLLAFVKARALGPPP